MHKALGLILDLSVVPTHLSRVLGHPQLCQLTIKKGWGVCDISLRESKARDMLSAHIPSGWPDFIFMTHAPASGKRQVPK